MRKRGFPGRGGEQKKGEYRENNRIIGTATADPWMAFNDTKIRPTGNSVSELSKALGTPAPPCCSDSITSIACRRLQAANPIKFLNRFVFFNVKHRSRKNLN